MSLLSRILPHGLCCFYLPREQDESRPTTSHGQPHIVPRKPVPYTMINVPHEPETMDEHAFRRMLTASPACPLEATPFSNGQRQEQPKQAKRQHLKARGSLDAGYVFNAGSPTPPSNQARSAHIKSKTSRLRVHKKSYKGDQRTSHTTEPGGKSEDLVKDQDAVMLGFSAQSTGLSDILRSRNASGDGYDSDAKVIKTPELNTAKTTFIITPKSRSGSSHEIELAPEDSMSNCPVSPSPPKASVDVSPKRLVRSSPYPCTPEKVSFTDALQSQTIESPSTLLKRLSAGIAGGIIKPPTDQELCKFKTPVSRDTAERWKHTAEAPQTGSMIDKEPDTPQTVIRRLSDLVQSEKKVEAQQDLLENCSENKRSSLLTQLEPALLEYLSRFSERPSLDLNLHDEVNALETTSNAAAILSAGQVNTEATSSSMPDFQGQQIAEVASVVSGVPSEHNSVHLFNMDISERLASRSNATMLSPPISNNTSERSLEVVPPMPSIPRVTPSRYLQPTQSGRAEHNRRPSDPRTRQLFERSDRRFHPYWKASSTSVDKSRALSCERDNASSVYSIDCGSRMSTGELANAKGGPSIKKNVNSLAVGGRSASTEIPIRRSSRAYGTVSDLPYRSLSVSESTRSGQLRAASEVISQYLDGEVDTRLISNHGGQTTLGPIPIRGDLVPKLAANTSPCDKPTISDTLRVENGPQGRYSTKPPGTSFEGSSAHSATGDQEHQGAKVQTVGSDVFPFIESANDMWNRVYQEARAESSGGDFLATSRLLPSYVQRRPSYNSLLLQRRSSSVLHTSRSVVRRSRSVGSELRRSFSDHKSSDEKGASRISRTMRRLSFWQLKSPQEQANSGSLSRKLQKRISLTFPKRSAVDFRAAHTPPLDHYLGYWGSFPSHDRATRNGPAAEPDDVSAHNFGKEQIQRKSGSALRIPLKGKTSMSTLSAMHNKTMRIFSSRPNKLDRKKSRSMSSVSPTHCVEKTNRLLFGRWQNHERTKSPEWQTSVTPTSRRSSFLMGRLGDYPDLEPLPGNNLIKSFDVRPRMSAEVDLPPSEQESGLIEHTDHIDPSNVAAKETVRDPMIDCGKPQLKTNNKSATWEPITFANMSESDQRTKENAGRLPPSSDNERSTPKVIASEISATFPRTSKDLKMPGGFQED